MKNINEKIDAIKKVDIDTSELLDSIYKYYTEKQILNKEVKILKDDGDSDLNENVIVLNVKEISKYPIWNTKMRMAAGKILEKLSSMDDIDLKKLFASDIFKEIKHNDNLESIDSIIDRIKNKFQEHEKVEIYFVDQEFNDSDIFMMNEITNLEIALNCSDKYTYIYDTVCNNLDKSLSSFNFCNFKENKCISQRHKSISNRYPYQKKDGCCFNTYKTCSLHNNDGTCKTRCLACKLFMCPYLSKRGIGLYASEILLIRAFFNKKQRRCAVFDFFEKEEDIINKIKRK